jgi:hypothetical protein
MTLQTGNADALSIEYIIDSVDESFEHHTHEVCSRYHIQGEWFRGDAISNHLLKHPWFVENMKPYSQWLKEQTNAIHSSNAGISV